LRIKEQETRLILHELDDDDDDDDDLSVFIAEAESVYCGTNWVFKSDRYSFVLKELKN
jgi:hypothetical protein